MYKGLTILLACCAFYAKAQQVYMVSPKTDSADTIRLCSSDPFPILEAGVEQSTTISSIKWYLNDVLLSNSPRIKTTETGIYKMVASGAYIKLEKTIVVEIPVSYVCETIIPNVFTPNGDGKNDTFTILNLEHYPNSALTVYTRWGRKVFENTNYRNDWDGSNLEDGSYYFILKRNDGQEFKGSVTILR